VNPCASDLFGSSPWELGPVRVIVTGDGDAPATPSGPEPEWRWLRAVFVLPTMVAMPALAVIWTALYQPSEAGESGPVNALLLTIGMTPHAWLREPSLALPGARCDVGLARAWPAADGVRVRIASTAA